MGNSLLYIGEESQMQMSLEACIWCCLCYFETRRGRTRGMVP